MLYKPTYTYLSSNREFLQWGISINKSNSCRLASSDDPYVQSLNKNFGNEMFRGLLETVGKLQPIASKLDISLANLAYAWVLKNPRISSAITGGESKTFPLLFLPFI